MARDDDPDRLSSDDAHILGMESAVIMGHTLKLNVLESGSAAIDVESLREAVASRLASEPRATQRVDTSGRAPRWVTSTDFDIRQHVRRYPSGEGCTRADLWRSVSALMSEHLDRTKPLWTFDVLGPLDDGREAIAVRFHHAMVDGIAGVEFLGALLWDDYAERPGTAVRRPQAGSTRIGQLKRLPAALLRELGHPAAASPLDRCVTASRELAFAVVPLDEVKAIGASRPERATVNDVLLAIIAGGLHEWLSRLDRIGRPHGTIRAQIPVSLHRRDDVGLGNQDSFFNLDLHHHAADPLTQLDLIRADTSVRKALDDADALYDLFHALGRVERVDDLVHRLTESSHEFAVAISNVPGPVAPVSVAGRRVEHLFSSSEPALHHALRISAISCAGEIGIALCTDPTVLPNVSELAVHIEASYGALRAAAREGGHGV